MLSLSKHLSRVGKPIVKITYAGEMLRQAQHDGLIQS